MPFDLLDPITADGPTRNWKEEEDYDLYKANVAADHIVPPRIEDIDPSVIGCPIVVLVSSLGECLASALVDADAEPMGRVSGTASTSAIYRMPGGANVVVADVAPERSIAWIREVFKCLEPTSVFVVSGKAGFNFRGTIDAESTSHNVYCLHTNREKTATSVPSLPNSNLLDGLGAASMLEAESLGLPASAVIAIELSRSPEAGLVCAVGNTLLAMLERRSLSAHESERIKKACATKYAASADLSVYV